MMKRRISIFFLGILLAIFLVSCGNKKVTSSLKQKEIEDKRDIGSRIVLVYKGQSEDGNLIRVYVDSETRVMYLYVKEGYGIGLSVMEDSKGKPLLWED